MLQVTSSFYCLAYQFDRTFYFLQDFYWSYRIIAWVYTLSKC
jgi:hypothetical protein